MGHTREVWFGEDGVAVILFDEGQRVVHRHWSTDHPSWIHRLRDRFGI
jgi:hypothetical protein